MTLTGVEPVDWDGLGPHVEHPTKEAVLAALGWIGPLSVGDLTGIFDDPVCNQARVSYHKTYRVSRS